MHNPLFRLSEVYQAQLLKEQYESSDATMDLARYEGVPAIYLWTRKLSPPQVALANAPKFQNWLTSSLARIQGVVTGRVSHFGAVRLSIGGGEISPNKQSAIAELFGSFDDRKIFQSMMADLDFSVVLYVGETDDLVRRIGEHLAGRTDFAKRVDEYGHGWSDLGLRFITLPSDVSVAQRQALERVIAILTLAPVTSRAG